MDAVPLAPDGLRSRRGRDVVEGADVSIVILVMNDTSRLERCLDSLRDNLATSGRAEVLVLANGTPPAALAVLQEREDIMLIRSQVNHGFGGGCNWAARFARGRLLLFLNDDAEVTSGWLEALTAAVDSSPDIAVVGSRILLADGSLQEAGSVIWRDGTTYGIGRGGDPDASQYLVRRTVDYVSFCSAMVRRDAWEAVGGFDERYFPAYYEDADLSMALRERGWRTVYEPRSVVHHAESASTVLRFRHFISQRNRELFMTKWSAAMERHEPAPVRAAREQAVLRSLRRAGGGRPTLLMIDDCEPDPGLGAGFGRMHDAVAELSGAFDITFVASYLTVDVHEQWHARRRRSTRLWLGDMGVELCVGDAERAIRAGAPFDAVLLSRPTNYAAFGPLLERYLPGTPLVYDTESLWHRRLFRQAALATGDTARRLHADAVHYQEVEESATRSAAAVICLTEEEAAVVRDLRKDARVAIVPANLVGAAATAENFGDRAPYMLFAASWLAGRDSPNLAAMRWMAVEVMPRILDAAPWSRLLVTGAGPPPEVTSLEGPSVTTVGFVSDLQDLYSRVRVVVCPMLAGAGVKLKVVEALQSGVPTVSTTIGAEGIDTYGLDPLAVTDDADQFAAHCIALITDPAAWSEARSRVVAYSEARSAHNHSARAASWRAVVRGAIESRSVG
jgi:GT2 family glycosyltransferase